MKRFHVHVGVADLNQSIAFYSGLFGAEPSVKKPEYAKWMLDDPRVNFAISTKTGDKLGIEHLGIQAENAQELGDVYAKLQASGRPVLDEGEAQCCYAQSTKNWVTDPDGVIWEAFHSHGELTDYGNAPNLAALADTAPCCTTQALQSDVAEATAKPLATTPCCG
jgi:catechol 2,3-dioxygenase-like lactoylglutathione lyase family enzyme